MKIKSLLISAFFATTALTTWGAEAKYIFYFIGDGMGMGPVMATQTYNREVLKNDQPLTMMQFPTISWCQTYSASSPVTDSAAAGTALSTGTKTRNGMLGVSPDTVAVESVAKTLFDDGYGVGIITSVSPFDATPGAFYAHVPSRSQHFEIGTQAAESGYQFLAGAGSVKKDDKDITEVMTEHGVQVIYGPDQIKDINSERVFLINPEGCPNWNIGYTIDSIAGRLTLPQMTQAGLDHLMKTSPDKFFMMVEGGNIDHALHGNDGGTTIIEILNFDEAIKIAYNFYLAHPDETLILVTADHDTGGMGMGMKYKAPLEKLSHQRVSKAEFSEYCKAIAKDRRDYQWPDMKEYLSENFGLFTEIPIDEAQEQKLKEQFDAAIVMRNSEDQKTLYDNFNAFAVDVFRLVNDAAGLGYTSMSHTGNPVPVFAIGVGADSFSGFNNNDLMRGLILKAAGK